MNIRITAIISLFILFFVGTGNVSAQDDTRTIKGRVVLDDIDNMEKKLNYNYSAYVKIYTFLTIDYANEALVALKKRDKVMTAEGRPIKPDSNGLFSIKVAPEIACILIWCDDYDYKAKIDIIPSNYFSQNMQIELVKKSAALKKDEIKADTLDDAVITEKKVQKKKSRPTSGNDETPDGMVCTFRHKIPCRVSDYMRVLVQPILYDRSDISNFESDTVYSYGHAIYCNMEEYDLTQLHRMDFDLSHDSINYYTRLQGDSLFYDALMADTMRSINDKPHVLLNLTHDTIDVYVADRFRGYDPDASHPYPYGVNITVDDYNSEIYSFYFRNNGERRNALRFLDFSFKEFLPKKELFFEDMDVESIPHPGELKLNFGKAGNFVLAANDTASHAALKKLEQELYQAQHSDERERLHRVSVFGIASPEGNMQSNLALAAKRADFAYNKIRSYIPSRIPVIKKTAVAEWKILADSLKKGGHEDVANAIYDIVNRFPLKHENDAEGFRIQQNEIAKLPQYKELILNEYLPKLRTVTYNYVINRDGKLPTDTVIARYRRNPKKSFNRGEYWELFENLKDKRELMAAAKYALEVTRDTYTADTIYSKGYWPYAAAVLACCYIACDTVDLELLKPFLDLELDSLGNWKEVQIKRSTLSQTRVVCYINQADMAANQLIMSLKNKGGYNTGDLAVLEAIIETAVNNPVEVESAAYERLLAFSLCLRGQYKRTEDKYVKARDLVASSSDHNYVVMALAMDDPSTPDDDSEWLYGANSRVESLEKSAVADYMNAVAKLRIEAAKGRSRNFEQVEELLAGCFVNDIKYLLIAANDADFLVKQGEEERVFPKALLKWAEAMDEKNLDETHPYHWFKKAWDEVRAKSPDNGLIEERLNKCFSIDERYITVLNIYMRDNSKGMEKGRVEMLRNIRDRYKLKN